MVDGFYIFCGEQGSGKTISAIQFCREILKKSPKIRLKSNIKISFQDGKIEHWQDILYSNNGSIGEIDFIDEIQNFFSLNDSNNLPYEIILELTQHRLHRKVIVGTSDSFNQMSKPLRELIDFVCLPFTILGCLTFVLVFKPIFDDFGFMIDKRFCKIYFFFHDKQLRECYDTY